MDQYPVPQFIEQEGKIAFFLSFSQFFYMAGAGLICFVFYYILPTVLFIPLAFIVFAVAIGLAFVKINGSPLLNLVMSSFGFAVGGKNYVWKKAESPYPFKPITRTEIRKIEEGPKLHVQQSHLKRAKTAVELKTK
jgi:hypothetical protein